MKSFIKESIARLGVYTSPAFIIIGAQKAGTTGLFNILKQHKSLHAKNKELHYFSNDEWYQKSEVHQYHAHFPLPKIGMKKIKTFESTPIYLYHPEVAKRLAEYKPDLKLIVSLRDPAYRALSAWTMYHYHFQSGPYTKYHDPRDFRTAVSEEIENLEQLDFYSNKKGYVSRGIYHQQLERYLQHFERGQLHIIEHSVLSQFSEETSASLQEFLGVPYQKLKTVRSNKARVKHKSNYTEEIQMLQSFFKPHNQALFRMIGQDYDWN